MCLILCVIQVLYAICKFFVYLPNSRTCLLIAGNNDIIRIFITFTTKFQLLWLNLTQQIRVYHRTNTVRAEKFSEILANAMSNYLKGLLTNEEVIEELLKTARAIVSGEEESKKLNLSTEELAFYDAITKPEAVQDFYTNEQLIAITRELTDALRTNKTIDWTMKESARAGMRRIVKRLLKKYKYPPEGQEAALETIMTQCEMWSENEYE